MTMGYATSYYSSSFDTGREPVVVWDTGLCMQSILAYSKYCVNRSSDC
jgi:hypothetical protein